MRQSRGAPSIPGRTRASPRAPLVALGEVVAVEVVAGGPDRAPTARQHVALDPPLRGSVETGFVTLVSGLFGGFCPGDLVFHSGDRVVIAATPDASGEIIVGPCRSDVRRARPEFEAWARAMPRKRRLAGHFVGAPPPRTEGAGGPEGTTSASAGRARVVRDGGGADVRIEGRVIEADEASVAGVWRSGRWDIAARVDVADLERVPVRSVSIAPGVQIAPGTSLDLGERGEDGQIVATYDAAGVAVVGSVPAADIGVVWISEEPRDASAGEPAAGGAEGVLIAEASWSARPDGPQIGTLRLVDSSPAAIFRRDRSIPAQVDGRVRTHISAPGLSAVGWIDAAALRWDEEGGRVGGIAGMSFSGRPSVEIAEGTWIVDASGRPVARSADAGALASWLVTDAGRVWVDLDTPWGSVVGSVACDAIEGTARGCG